MLLLRCRFLLVEKFLLFSDGRKNAQIKDIRHTFILHFFLRKSSNDSFFHWLHIALFSLLIFLLKIT